MAGERGHDAAEPSDRCPQCGAHHIRDLPVCHNCGYRFDGMSGPAPRPGVAPPDHEPVAGSGPLGGQQPRPTPVRLVPDPLEREQVARVVRALYEIGCVVTFGALVGALITTAIGAAVWIRPGTDPGSAALGLLLSAALGAWLGGYVVVRFIARDD